MPPIATTELGADLTSAFTTLGALPASPPPLDLDADALPPLDDFSSVEEALMGGLANDLGTLPDLDLPLSSTLSPRPPLSDSSVSSRSLDASPASTHNGKPPCCPDVRAALHEVSARLKAASAENAALRSRVADLVRENRSLRGSLDVARKQAQANPLLLGLAQVSAEAASTLANALNVPRQPPGKKRKRAAAGKTLACLVLMCGFFFGSPGVLNDGAERTDANLPAIWKSSANPRAVAPAARNVAPPVRPSLCLRTLEQLPPPELASTTTQEEAEDANLDNKTVRQDVMVKKEPKPATAVTGMEPAYKKRRTDGKQFSYVMCRDAEEAIGHVSACSRKLQKGMQCGPPHEIKLIMPAAALRGDEDVNGDDEYAEVKCSIVSVKRIPAKVGVKSPGVSGVQAARAAMATPGLGRVLATVREEVVGT